MCGCARPISPHDDGSALNGSSHGIGSENSSTRRSGTRTTNSSTFMAPRVLGAPPMDPRLPAVVVTLVFLEVLLASAFLALGNMIGAIGALLFGLVISSLGIFALEVRKFGETAQSIS